MNGIRDLFVDIDGGEVSLAAEGTVDDPVLVGEPMHEPAADVLARYESDPLESFLAEEARRSAGNYVVVDPGGDRVRYVTSPGHSVSYLSEVDGRVRLATTYRRLFEALGESASINTEVLEHLLRTNIVTVPPYTGLFDSVRKIPPAYVIEFDGGVTRASGYLGRAADRPVPSSLGDALDECTRTVARFAERADRNVVVMFSGGVDSTSLLLGVRKHLDDVGRLTAVSCDWGPLSNGPERARAVADAVGVEMEVISADHEGWPPLDDEVLDNLRRELSTHLIKPQTPHHSLMSGYADPGDVVLSGQNMGLMIRAGHAGARQAIPSGFPRETVARHVISSLPFPSRKGIELFLMDFRFTDHYIRSGALKQAYRGLYRLLPDREVTYDASLFGYLYGALRSGSPNVPSNTYSDSDRTADCPEDVHRFLNEVRDDYTQRTVDMFYYYWYSANAVDQQCSLPTPSGACLSLPAMWGPIGAWMLQHRRGVVDSLVPKRELYEYVRRETGRHYHQLTGMSPDDLREQQAGGGAHNQGGWESVLVDRFDDVLTDDPRLVELVSEGDRDRIREAYDESRGLVDDGTLSVTDVGRVYSAINAELILSPTD